MDQEKKVKCAFNVNLFWTLISVDYSHFLWNTPVNVWLFLLSAFMWIGLFALASVIELRSFQLKCVRNVYREFNMYEYKTMNER